MTSLESFLDESRTNLSSFTDSSKSLHQSLCDHKSDIDNSLKQLQMELEHSQPMLAKWVSGSNLKLRTEQVSQMRIDLCNTVQKMTDKLNQLSQDMEANLMKFSTSSHSITTDMNNLQNQIDSSAAGGNFSAVGQKNAPVDQMLDQAISALSTVSQSIEQRRVINDLNKSLNNLMG